MEPPGHHPSPSTTFQSAFCEALAALTPRERNLLRQSVIDQLGIDQLAAIHRVPRADAARQLDRAWVRLIDATREGMRATLRVSEAELEGTFRAVMGAAEATLRHFLGEGPDEPEPSVS
jgi:hypothetical protein